MMRIYIPIAELEARDPAWAQRIRERDRKKQQRLRASDPEGIAKKAAIRYQGRRCIQDAKNREWRKAHPECDKAIKDRYWRNTRARYIVQSVRSEARKKGVFFDISVEWVQERLTRGVCELSGLPFDLESRRTNLRDQPSIDRRIPGGDYVEGNCRMVLFGLNSKLRGFGDAGVHSAIARVRELRTA
jgi:hypothetical protein